MRWKNVAIVAIVAAALAPFPANAAPRVRAPRIEVPEWAAPALRYAVDQGFVERADFRPNRPMTRRAFGRVMARAFGGGFHRTKGYVTAGEVDAALVRALGQQPVARRLSRATGADGWDPRVGKRFGTEIVAREMGLRHDRPTSQEANEASTWDPMPQADVLWSVWKAKTSPSTYGADALASFSMPSYTKVQRDLVDFAFSQVGVPYIWGGEWPTRTPANYPYGAQPTGGVDCSGFSWVVLREKSSGWAPPGRDYRGWSLPQRSSSDMAAATPRRQRLSYKELRPGDLLVFAPDGRRSGASSVYHAGVYLGRGWMIDSAGSQAGVSLSDLSPGTWWHTQFAWGRRILPSR